MSGRWAPERLAVDAYAGPGLDLPIFFNDLDPNKHLNNVALGRFFEQARVEHFAGLHRSLEPGHVLLVVRVAIDYLSEGLYGTPLHLRTRTGRIGTSSVTVEQACWQDGRVVGLCEATLAHTAQGRSAPLPERTRALLADHG